MGFWDRLKSWFSAGPSRRHRIVRVRCDKCGEVLETRVDLYHDLSVEYGDRPAEDRYHSRKVLMGDNCFQRVEVELQFNQNRKLTEVEVDGGEFLPEGEVE